MVGRFGMNNNQTCTTATTTNAAGAKQPALDTLLAMQPRLDAQATVRNADIDRHEREGRETKMRLLKAMGVLA